MGATRLPLAISICSLTIWVAKSSCAYTCTDSKEKCIAAPPEKISRQLSVIGCYMGGLKELRKVIALVEKGKLKPVIDKVFPLEEAGAAHALVATNETFGKVLLAVARPD